jgi:hypothetical protein
VAAGQAGRLARAAAPAVGRRALAPLHVERHAVRVAMCARGRHGALGERARRRRARHSFTS